MVPWYGERQPGGGAAAAARERVVRRRIYLRMGDLVIHQVQRRWGVGRVVEVRTSVLEGGPALVRIAFQDGKERTFFNDLDQPSSCYTMGIRLYRG